jgi:hypothetical protein
VLLATEGSLVAVGKAGVAWRSDEIATDDLKVIAIDDRGIVCTGFDGAELPSEFIVNPTSGKAIRLE